MSAVISSWLSDNIGRKYPLDDQASGISNLGRELPTAIIADMRLTLEAAGADPYISGVFINSGLISITVCGTSGPLLLGTFHRPTLEAYKPYQLVSIFGTASAGEITFGEGVATAEPRNYIFTSESGRLHPHSYTIRGSAYVKSLRGKLSAGAATGHVNALGTKGVNITIADSDTLEVGLSDQAMTDLQTAVTCNTPAINYINLVAPDANGKLYLRFK